jgi:ligand-binding sensor domain-containing protein/signal transduction histidine kinase
MFGTPTWLASYGHACRKVLVCIITIGAARTLWAQSLGDGATFVVDSWQIDAGLPHNSVTAIQQTEDGYLWLGTSNGLARFDGVRFTTFRAMDNPGLKSNRILCLDEDPQGVLWIGTEEGGVASYRNGQFSSLTMVEGLSSDTVLCLGTDQVGGLWIGTASGLSCWTPGQLTTFFKTDGLPDDRVTAVCQQHKSGMLFATGKGLCRFNGRHLGPYRAPDSAPAADNSCCLHEDRDGQLWIGSELGLFRTSLTNASGLGSLLKLFSARVISLLEQNNGGIWFGTSDGDLYRTSLSGGAAGAELAWHFQSPVKALYEDREGNVWVGTGAEGLFRFKRRQLRWLPFVEGIKEDTVDCVFETQEGELRLLAGGKKLYCRQNSGFTLIDRLPLPDGAVIQTGCASRTGEIWIGTLGDGLFQYKKGVLKQYSEREGISDSTIEVLCAEEDRGVWIGTRNGGLNHLIDGGVRRFNTPWGRTGNFPCVLAKDKEGSLWIGTTGDGLFQLWQGRFVAYTETNGLPSDQIRALHSDQNGWLWVGTAKGLCGIHEGRVTAFTDREGLPHDAILELRSDGEGNLWFGSGSGIFRVSKSQLIAYAQQQARAVDAVPYGKEDGLPAVQCTPSVQPQAWQSRSAEIWFSTAKGIVTMDWRGASPNPVPPPVVIERVLVEHESVPLEKVIRLAPGKESLQFQYTALSLTAPGKICFRYQLEGFDRDWSETSANRTAPYPKVPPGKYRFRVVARNNDAVWNEAGAGVAIVVAPFWWASNWFRAGLVAGTAVLLAGLYRLRHARREELERLRVRIAGDLHDDVGSSLWSIILLSRTLSKHGALGAEEQKDVEEIHRISVQTSNAIRDIIWLINPAFDTVQDLVLRIKDFAGTLLRGIDYRMHCTGTDPSKKLPFDLRQNLFFLFKEATTNIAKHAQATIVEVHIEEYRGSWRFSIQDNGLGFDPTRVAGGNGLKNLRFRARKMGAELEIQSACGKGTTLVFTMARPRHRLLQK